MAEYEVKVTPVIDVDIQRAQNDLKKLIEGIEKTAGKGKVTVAVGLNVDTDTARRKIEQMKPVTVAGQLKLETRELDTVKKDIIRTLQQIDMLNKKSKPLNEIDTKTNYRGEALIAVNVKQLRENLAKLKQEYIGLGGVINKDVFGSSFTVRQLEIVEAKIRESETVLKDYIKSYKKLFEGEKLTIPVPTVEKYDAKLVSQVAETAKAAQSALDSRQLRVDISLDEVKRKYGDFISEINDKVEQLNAIIIPQPTARDVNSKSYKLAKQMYGSDMENYTEEGYSADVINLHRKKVGLVAELVSLIKQLDVSSQEAINREMVGFERLNRIIVQSNSQIEHHTSVLEHLNRTAAADSVEREINVTVAVDDAALQRQITDVVDTGQSAVDAKPLVIKSEFDSAQLDAIIEQIIKRGKEAQKRLDALGPEKLTKNEIGSMAAASGQVENFNALIESYKSQGAYSERLTKTLKAERAEREELKNIIDESKKVLSGKDIEFTSWGLLKEADPSVAGKAFNEYMRGIRELKQEAQEAEEVLVQLASGMKKYIMEYNESYLVERKEKLQPEGTTQLTTKYEEVWAERVRVITGYANSVEELEQRYYGAIQGRHDYDPAKIVAREVSVTQDEINALTRMVVRYNQVLQEAGSGVTNAFGTITLPDIPVLMVSVAADTSEAKERIDAVVSPKETVQVDVSVNADIVKAEETIEDIIKKLTYGFSELPSFNAGKFIAALEKVYGDVATGIEKINKNVRDFGGQDVKSRVHAIRDYVAHLKSLSTAAQEARSVLEGNIQLQVDTEQLDLLKNRLKDAEAAYELVDSTKNQKDGDERIEAFQKAHRLYGEVLVAERAIQNFLGATEEQVAAFVARQKKIIDTYRDFDKGIVREDTKPIIQEVSQDLTQSGQAVDVLDEKQQRMIDNFINNLKGVESESDKLRIALERLAQLKSADIESLIGVMHSGNSASLKMLTEFTGLPTNNKKQIATAIESINPEAYAEHYRKINAVKEAEHQKLLAEEQRRKDALNKVSQGYAESFNTDVPTDRMALGKFKAAIEKQYGDLITGIEKLNQEFANSASLQSGEEKFKTKVIQDYIAYLRSLKDAYEEASKALQNPLQSATDEKIVESLFSMGGYKSQADVKVSDSEVAEYVQRQEAIINSYVEFMKNAGVEIQRVVVELQPFSNEETNIQKNTEALKQQALAAKDLREFIASTNTEILQSVGLFDTESIEKFFRDTKYELRFEPHELSLQEAINIIKEKMSREALSGWYGQQKKSYKTKIEEIALNDDEVRNAGLNIAWQNYKKFIDGTITYSEYLSREMEVFRGKNYKESFVDGDQIQAHTYVREVAEKFGKIIQTAIIKPIESIGNYNVYNDGLKNGGDESEIFVRNDKAVAEYKQNVTASLNAILTAYDVYYNSLDAMSKAQLDRELKWSAERRRNIEYITPDNHRKQIFDAISTDTLYDKNNPQDFQLRISTEYTEIIKLIEYLTNAKNAAIGVNEVLSEITSPIVTTTVVSTQATDEAINSQNQLLAVLEAVEKQYDKLDEQHTKKMDSEPEGGVAYEKWSDAVERLTEKMGALDDIKINLAEGIEDKDIEMIEAVRDALREWNEEYKGLGETVKKFEGINLDTVFSSVESVSDEVEMIVKQVETTPIEVPIGLNPVQEKDFKDSVQFIRDTIADGAEGDAAASLDRYIQKIIVLQSRLQSTILPSVDDTSFPKERKGNMYQDSINGFNSLQDSVRNAIGMIKEFANLSDTKLSLKLDIDALNGILEDAKVRVASLEGSIAALNEKKADVPVTISQPEPVEVEVMLKDETLETVKGAASEIKDTIGEFNKLFDDLATDIDIDNGFQLKGYIKAAEMLKQIIALRDELENIGGGLRLDEKDLNFITTLADKLEQMKLDLDSANLGSGIDVGDLKALVQSIDEAITKLRSEKSVIETLNETYEGHTPVVEKAASAEQSKEDASKKVTKRLREEAAAVSELNSAVEEAVSGAKSDSIFTLDISKVRVGENNFDTSGLEEELKNIFNEALNKDKGYYVYGISINAVLDEKSGKTIQQAAVTFKNNTGNTIREIYRLIANEAEEEGEKATSTLRLVNQNLTSVYKSESNFDKDIEKQIAAKKIDRLRPKAEELGGPELQALLANLDSALNNITDSSSLKDFTNQWKLLQEAIKAAEAQMLSTKQLDTTAAMKRQVERFGSDINDLVKNIELLKIASSDGFQRVHSVDDIVDTSGFENITSVAEAFNRLDESVWEARKTLAEFMAIQGDVDISREIKTEKFDEVKKTIQDTENQFDSLNRQQRVHKKEFEDYMNTIKKIGDLSIELYKADPDNKALADSLNTQISILATKRDKYQLTERQRFSELELNKIIQQREMIAKKVSDTMSSATKTPTVTPINPLKLDSYQVDIDKLNVSLGKITKEINPQGYEDVERAIQGVVNALSDLRKANGSVEQKDRMAEFEAQIKITKQSLNNLRIEEIQIRGLERLGQNAAQLDSRLDKMEKNWSAFKADPDLEIQFMNLKTRVDEYKESLKEARKVGESGKPDVKMYDELNKRYQALNQEVRTFAADTQGAGLATKSFSDRIAETSQRLAAYLVSFFSFQEVLSMLKSAYKSVLDIDNSMTALVRVTNEVSATYNQFLVNAYDRAQKLGTSVAKIIDATADFARLGYTLTEAEKLGDAASIYFNVGNSGSDTLPMEEAVQSIISTMKAFGIEAANSMLVVDKFNEVGNNFAISSKGIGDALFRSASSLAAANNTLDESIGLIVAANNVVQNPEVVGTALKTMSMRLRNTAGELEKLGEDADGAAESITKLQTQLLNITGGRVDIMKNANEFKSTYQILMELSKVWGSLTDTAQAEVTRLVAGVRQGNVLTAMMEGMGDAASVVETSLNSMNSAINENQIWLISLEGKMSLLKASAEALANKLIDSGMVKFFLDGGIAITKFLGAYNGFMGKMVSLPAVVFAIAVALKALEVSKLGETIKSTINNIKTYSEQAVAYGKAWLEVGNAMKSVGDAQEQLSNKFVLMNANQQMSIITKIQNSKATDGEKESQIAYLIALRASTDEEKKAIKSKIELMYASKAKGEMTQKEINSEVYKMLDGKGKLGADTGMKIGMGLVTSIFTAVSTYSSSKKAKDVGEAVGSSIGSSISGALAGFMVAGPWGAVAGAAAGIVGGIAGYIAGETERLIEVQRNLIKESDTNISKWAEERVSLQQLRNALLDAKDDKQKLWAISQQLNEVIGETPGLILGEVDAWEIANEKLGIQIQLLDEQIKRAKDQKVESNRNIFSSQRLAYTWDDGIARNIGGEMTQEKVIAEMEKAKQELVDMYAVFDKNIQSFDDILIHQSYSDSYATRAVQARVARYETFLRGLTETATAVFNDYIKQQNMGRLGEDFALQFIESAVFAGKNLDEINVGLDQIIDVYRRIDDEQNKFISARRKGQDGDSNLAAIQQELENLIVLFPFAEKQLVSFGATLATALNVNTASNILSPEGFQKFTEDAETAMRAMENFMNLLSANDTTLPSMMGLSGGLDDYIKSLSKEDLSKYIDQQFHRVTPAIRTNILNIVSQYQDGAISVEHAARQLELSFGKQILDATIVQSIQGLREAFWENTEVVDGMISSYGNLAATLTAVRDAMDKISTAQQEMNEYGFLSMDTVLELLESNERYADLLEIVDGKVQLVADAEEQLTNQKLEAVRANLELGISQAQLAIEQYHAAGANYELVNSLSGSSGLTGAALLASKAWVWFKTLLSDGLDAANVAAAAVGEVAAELEGFSTPMDLSQLEENLANAERRLELFDAMVTQVEGNSERAGKQINSIKPNVDWVAVLNNALTKYLQATNELEKSHWADIVSTALSNLKKEAEEGIISWELYARITADVEAALLSLSDHIDGLSSAYTSLTAAVDEYNEYGDLTIDTVMKLLEYGDEYLQYLDFSEGKLVLNTAAIDERIAALKDEMIASQQAALAEEIRGIVEDDLIGTTVDLTNATDDARVKLINIGSQALATAQEMGSLAAAYIAAAEAATLISGNVETGGMSDEAVARIEAAINNAQKRVNLINSSFQPTKKNSLPRGTAPSRESKSSSSSNDVYKESVEKEIKDLKYLYDKRLITEETYLNRLNAINERAYKGREKYIDDYRKYELEVINGLQKARENKLNLQLSQVQNMGQYDKQIEIYRQLQDDLHNLAEEYRYRGFKDTDNEIIELQNKWHGYFNNIRDVMSQKLELRVEIAQESLDFNSQISIYREYQQLLHDEANNYRAMGLTDEDSKIQELQKKYRAYSTQIVSVYDEVFKKERERFDKHLSSLEFKLSITDESNHAQTQQLINQKLENRLGLSQELLNQLVRLRLETDDNIRSTQAYKDLMYDLESAYQENINAIYDLVNAHKQQAEHEISDVRDLQEKVIQMIRARYQKEQELLKENYDIKKKQISDEKDILKKRYDAEVKYIDDMLKALNKQWTEEDKRKKKKQDDDDINEIMRKINELKIAADSGDAEAISRLEDLYKQLREKQSKLADDAEKEARDVIRDELNERKDALKEKYDLDTDYLDKRQEIIDKEYEAEQKLLDLKLENANLYAEAKEILERGVNQKLIQQLKDYEDEFGEGMGILGDYVKTKLTQQIYEAGSALRNLANAIEIATDTRMFDRLMGGEDIVVRNIFEDMFDTENMEEIMAQINRLINNIDASAVNGEMDILRQEFRSLGEEFVDMINGNVDFARRAYSSIGNDDSFSTHMVMDESGAQYTIKVISRLANGKVLSPEELSSYVQENINGAANLLEVDTHELIVATSIGWDEDAFVDLDERIRSINQRYNDLLYSIQENVDKFVKMSDEGLFNFIDKQFGEIPEAARNAIVEALRELGEGKVSLEDALEKIFNMPMDNANSILNRNLATLTQEQIQVIEQMKANSIAWEEATTEAEKARLEAENERLALAQGWFKDQTTNSWYLDEDKTQKIFDMIQEIQNTQLEHIVKLVQAYEDEYKKYSEFQQKKLLIVKNTNEEIARANSNLLLTLSSNMQNFVNNVAGVLSAIAIAVNELTNRLNAVSQLAVSTQTLINTMNDAQDGTSTTTTTMTTTNMPKFAKGGLNKGAGVRFLDPDEQVLTAEQTRAFSELVFGLGSEGMRNISESIRKSTTPTASVHSKSLVEANFNFNGGVTQEALPQVKRMLNDAIYELKGEIPMIVANEQRDNLRRIGGGK